MMMIYSLKVFCVILLNTFQMFFKQADRDFGKVSPISHPQINNFEQVTLL